MPPYQPTREELLWGLDAVFYEIGQLLDTTASPVAVAHPLLVNAVVESRLVHVRTLLDFFEREEYEKDDVLAAHYGFPHGRIVLEGNYAERLDKDLAHLTYSRTKRTPSTKPWPTEKVVTPVLTRCRQFVDHILADRSIYGEVGPTAWRELQLRIQEFLESPQSRGL